MYGLWYRTGETFLETDLFSKEVLSVILKPFLKVLLNSTPIHEIVSAGQRGPMLHTQTSAHNLQRYRLGGCLTGPSGSFAIDFSEFSPGLP